MFATGRPHPLRQPCRRIVDEVIPQQPEAFCTDAEVLQELLHRYRRGADPGLALYLSERILLLLSDRIEPLLAEDVLRAATLVPSYARLSARDLVHLAVMERLGVNRMASADAGFDGIAWLTRLDPLALDAWESTVGQ